MGRYGIALALGGGAIALWHMGLYVGLVPERVLPCTATGPSCTDDNQLVFGIPIPRGTPFYEILHQLYVQFLDINPWVLSVSAVTLATGILTKKYLKKHSLREFLYVIAKDKKTYEIKYFNIQQEEADQE